MHWPKANNHCLGTLVPKTNERTRTQIHPNKDEMKWSVTGSCTAMLGHKGHSQTSLTVEGVMKPTVQCQLVRKIKTNSLYNGLVPKCRLF